MEIEVQRNIEVGSFWILFFASLIDKLPSYWVNFWTGEATTLLPLGLVYTGEEVSFELEVIGFLFLR